MTNQPKTASTVMRHKRRTILRCRESDDATYLDKAWPETGDPFATFSEWWSDADEKAYRPL